VCVRSFCFADVDHYGSTASDLVSRLLWRKVLDVLIGVRSIFLPTVVGWPIRCSLCSIPCPLSYARVHSTRRRALAGVGTFALAAFLVWFPVRPAADERGGDRLAVCRHVDADAAPPLTLLPR
jgi:hypothetical protein